MTLKDENGLSISLTYDGDGFPLIEIDTGSGFIAERNRPTLAITLNGVEIFDMFDEDDSRWVEATP